MTLKINNTILFILILISVSLNSFAQPSEKKMSPNEYITKYKDDAIREMLQSRVPASITLAQGMLESGNGNSALSVYANNHFGIKCHKNWLGETYTMDDDEKNECFRKYPTVLDSYSDHSAFLKSRDRYAFLFELSITDYQGWAKGLKQAGYATHPKYADQLIELIELYKLNQYDEVADLKPPVANTAPVVNPELQLRPVMRFNHTKFIIAKNGDSFYKIASEYNLELEDLLKYNDFTKDEKISVGQKIFIQRKRRKALEPFHVVTKGETMKSISQLHGIRIYHLYKKNKMQKGQEPKVGDVLYLRGKKPETK